MGATPALVKWPSAGFGSRLQLADEAACVVYGEQLLLEPLLFAHLAHEHDVAHPGDGVGQDAEDAGCQAERSGSEPSPQVFLECGGGIDDSRLTPGAVTPPSGETLKTSSK